VDEKVLVHSVRLAMWAPSAWACPKLELQTTLHMHTVEVGLGWLAVAIQPGLSGTATGVNSPFRVPNAVSMGAPDWVFGLSRDGDRDDILLLCKSFNGFPLRAQRVSGASSRAASRATCHHRISPM